MTHQFVPKFVDKTKCMDCGDSVAVHDLTAQEIRKLQECDGVHNTLDDIFKCDSCAILF
jgi:hypothetical protein